MGLLDGRKALIFGVANDHSIAWGIARALHAEGRMVGFSSIEMPDREARPAAGADRWGPTSWSRATSRTTPRSQRVFARWQARHGSLDILVHALAFAKREDLEGAFVRHLARGLRDSPWTSAPTRWWPSARAALPAHARTAAAC